MEFDVIIVGGGVAGLEAARLLAQASKRVLLLEGRQRLGGRIWTQKSTGDGGPVEIGAEFVHGGNKAMEELVRSASIKKQRVEVQHWWVEDGVRHKKPDAWDRIDGVMKKIGPKFRGSFGQWVKRHRTGIDEIDRKLAETFVKGFQGAPIERMSAHSLFEATKEDEEQSRLVGGYERLVDALSNQLGPHAEVQRGVVVDHVKWRSRQVTVLAGAQRWDARAALLTVPLGVLKAPEGTPGSICFDPRLRAKERLLKRLESGHALRVVFRLRKNIWSCGVIPPELRGRSGRDFGFLHSDQEFFPVWWAEAPRPILVGWTGGPAVEKLAGFSDEKIVREARRSLAKLLGRSAAALGRVIVDEWTHDWASDPLTRGAYSYSIAGQEKAPELLSKPVSGVLFFAGEATADPLELGTVHGALASGARAAREVLKALK